MSALPPKADMCGATRDVRGKVMVPPEIAAADPWPMARKVARLAGNGFLPPVLSSPVAIPVAILERPNAMPRDGAIIFNDLVGKLDVLRVEYD